MKTELEYITACDRISILMDKELLTDDELFEIQYLVDEINAYQEIHYKLEPVDKETYNKIRTEELDPNFNPEAHINLIIDFDKVETIAEASVNYMDKNGINYPQDEIANIAFVTGAKSEAARNYWFKIFNEEQKPNVQLIDSKQLNK